MRYILHTLLLLAAVASVGCNQHKTIPDRELAAIFHDAVVVNSYIGNESIKIDSLNIYEPIFESYGYTTDDVRYTIASFLRRKSANLSDVVDEMIDLVEQEYDLLELAVTKLDTIENVARREARREILRDTAIVVRTAKDSVRMYYEVPFEGAGHYEVLGRYSIDTLDLSRGRRFTVRKMLKDSTTKQIYAALMHRTSDAKALARIEILEQDADDIIALQVHFNDFRNASTKDKALYPKPKVVKMDIHEVSIHFTPVTARSVEELYERQLGLRILSDTMFFGKLPTAESATTAEDVVEEGETAAESATTTEDIVEE